MFIFSILFLSGVVVLQFFTKLPPLYLSLIIILLIIIHTLFIKKSLKWLIPILLGFAWCLWYAHMRLAWILPDEEEGKPLLITGIISSIPDYQSTHTCFRFLVQKILYKNKIESTHSDIQLSWQFAPSNLRVGDQWQFTVYLKKIKGLMNPGGFDIEAWSFQEGIRATGYVIKKENKLVTSHWYYHPLDRIREYFHHKINESMTKTPTSHWITALAIGERFEVPVDDWKVLRNTGTNHLMAIAGLHIGFMAGFAFFSANVYLAPATKISIDAPSTTSRRYSSIHYGLDL